MNNQICYRMLYESGMLSVEDLRECYIDTYNNSQYSEHKDLIRVVIGRGHITQKQFDKILHNFLNNPGKQLVTVDNDSDNTGNEDIEKDIRDTNAAQQEKQIGMDKPVNAELATKKTIVTNYDTYDPESKNPLEQDDDNGFVPYRNPKTLLNIESQKKPEEKSKNLMLGDCILKRRVGEGSVGQVWLASHKKFGIDVAVKILNKKSAANKKMLKRFYVEGQLSSKLSHPNIIHVYEIDEYSGFHFIVMQYVDGVTLQEFVNKNDTSLKQQIFAILQTLDGLHYAHKRDIIHRDIKLENLMINTESVVKITDFGFSKHIGSSNITVSGDVFGTPYYMPPEQWEDSRSTDQQADIYATGVCLYKMISGKYPIDGESPVNIFKKMMGGNRTKIRKFVPDIDFELEQIIETAIALRRENRFRTSLDFGRKLAEYATIKNWMDIIPKIFSKEVHEDEKLKETQELKRKKKNPPKLKNIKIVKNFKKTLMVHCDNNLDGECLEEIEQFIAPLARMEKVQYLIFDMSKVYKITSLGFATMLRLNEMLQRNAGSIFILKPTKQAGIMLNMMSIDSLFLIFSRISELKEHLNHDSSEKFQN